MAMQAVEWVLVVYYGPEAHRAAYGRQVQSNRYTKDYIQLSRKSDFLNAVSRLFNAGGNKSTSVPLVYKWPTGSTPGAFVFNSSDRPHLKWETSIGAPDAWKMSLTPSESSAHTIPGDPSHLGFDAAERELAILKDRGAGQPYLMAIKLRDDPGALQLRVYLANPSEDFEWANVNLVPQEIQDLASKTTQRSALAWSIVHSGGEPPSLAINNALSSLMESSDPLSAIDALNVETCRALCNYLKHPAYGLFFDPALNHDAWLQPPPLSEKFNLSRDTIIKKLSERFPDEAWGDAFAESAAASADEIHAFQAQIEQKNYEVRDSVSTVKTRGSAQKVFADAVKANYGYKCAVTGIQSKSFLIASHIVPWSEDQSIRLDPSNGICLSLLVDKAFETGYLLINDDLTVHIDWTKVSTDQALAHLLKPYDGQALHLPKKDKPKVEHLQRRRSLVGHDK